ncbi:MAG: phage baseplate assembly protein V [Burkholderiaceae bacterium]|nr:phage baseplate assembly protein V [Burkholderiaceae bacterium]
MAQRLQLMIGRAVVLLVNDALKMQGLQVHLLADEVRDSVERFQEYGFTSHPLPGAEAIAAGVGGSRDHVVVLAVDDRRYRLRGLAQGEVAVYTDEGDKIVLRRGGVIEVTAAAKVRLVTPLVECTGNVTIDGTLQVDGTITSGATVTAAADVRDQGGTKSMAGMRNAYNAHKHGATPTPDQVM